MQEQYRKTEPEADPAATPPPSSILVVGAGVFGLSTALALLTRPRYANTHITILDSRTPNPTSEYPSTNTSHTEPPTASLDSSRIVRADYANPAYAALAAEAQELWRAGWGDWSIDPGELGKEIDQEDELGRNVDNGNDKTSTSLKTGSGRGGQPRDTRVHRARESTYTESGLVLTADNDSSGNGAKYVRESLANVLQLEAASKIPHSLTTTKTLASKPNNTTKVKVLPSSSSIQNTMTTSPALFAHAGSTGYLNPHSGWANATAAIRSLRSRLHSLSQTHKNLTWVTGSATCLVFSPSSKRTVLGVRLSTGHTLTASLTILATGAWSAQLLPSLGSQLTATGQILGYLQLTPEEWGMLRDMPVLLNMSTGMFVMPPTAEGLLKVARHGYGYRNLVRVGGEEVRERDPWLAGRKGGGGEGVEVGVPAEDFESLPGEGYAAFREFLAKTLPFLVDRPFVKTRVCWYTDTATGDFLIDWHQGYGGLFLATGGSGHGFKFLPVLGERVVDVLEGRCEAGLGRQLKDLWRWKVGENGKGDGSRGGRMGMVWEEEMRRGRKGVHKL